MKKYTREKLAAALQERRQRGMTIHPTEMKQVNGSFYNALRRYFGSIRKGLEAAGIDYCRVMGRKEWTAEEVIQAIRDRHAQGLTLAGNALVEEGQASLIAASFRLFDGWVEAKQAAGVPTITRWTRDLVTQRLQEEAAKGTDLSVIAIQSSYELRKLESAMKYLFGTRQEAFKAAGLDISRYQRKTHERWPKDRVSQHLLSLHSEGKLAVKHIPPTIYQAMRRTYGSLNQFREAVGLPVVKSSPGRPRKEAKAS